MIFRPRFTKSLGTVAALVCDVLCFRHKSYWVQKSYWGQRRITFWIATYAQCPLVIAPSIG